MNQFTISLAGALALTSGAALAQQPTRGVMPFNGEIIQGGVIDAATGAIIPAGSSFGMGADLGEPIYANTAIPAAGSFFSNIADATVYDEGRIPSTSSTNVVGTQDSYRLSSISLQYVTDATDPSLGGTGITIEINIYESYAACSIPDAMNPPVGTITLAGLPGSTTGGLSGFIFDVDISSLDICLLGDGDGVYSDGVSDRFGWSFAVTDQADATASGPFLRGDPDVQPQGDGTVFQNPALAGTGLDTADLFGRLNGNGSTQCLFFGGYSSVPGEENVFSSFGLVLRSPLRGGCPTCATGDDIYEPNDDNMSAAAIGLGDYQLVSNPADDWFSYTISPESTLIVDAAFINATSDLDLRIFDAATGTQLDSSLSTADGEQVFAGNCDSMNGLDVLIRLNNFSGNCNEYTLTLAEFGIPGDDIFEENDTCDTRVPLPLGVTGDLIVRPFCGSGTTPDDRDYYGITLMPGETINVDVLFTDAITDIDAVLYDVTASCPGTTLDTGFSTTDNEFVTTTNATAAPIDLALLVDWFSGDLGNYTLIVTVGDASIGDLICAGVENSTGVGAFLTATGDSAAAANDVTLDVVGLPMNSMGYFIVSQEANVVMNPGGSEGNICIASFSMGRYAGDVLDSGMAGAVSFSPDLTNIPVASGGAPGSSAAMAGDTYNFQLWYRDTSMSGAATSNFSSAVGITFN